MGTARGRIPSIGWLKVVRLKMTSERRVCLGLANVKKYRAPYFGRSNAESASAKWKVIPGLGVRVPGCQKLQMTMLNPVWHRMFDSSTHSATVGVKGFRTWWTFAKISCRVDGWLLTLEILRYRPTKTIRVSPVRSLVTSVLGHFGPQKGPKLPRTEVT